MWLKLHSLGGEVSPVRNLQEPILNLNPEKSSNKRDRPQRGINNQIYQNPLSMAVLEVTVH